MVIIGGIKETIWVEFKLVLDVKVELGKREEFDKFGDELQIKWGWL